MDPEEMKTSELRAAIVGLIGEAAFAGRKFVEKAEMRTFLREERERRDELKKGVHVVPAGRYILGDPCYAARDVHDLEHFNKTYYDKEDDDEEDDDDDDEGGPPRFSDGTVVTAFNTAKPGPAWFTDTRETMSVRVNGSVVAIVPLEYNPKFKAEGDVAHVVHFKEPTRCFAKRGVLHFGDIAFNTNRPIDVDDAEMFENNANDDTTTAGPKGNKTKEKNRFRRRPRPDDDDDDWKPPKPAAEKKRRRIEESDDDGDDGEAEFEFGSSAD